jgi:hypothetical protein
MALISRPVFYQLAELAEERAGVIGVVSRDCFMPLEPSTRSSHNGEDVSV